MDRTIVLALANAPAGTGRLIETALATAGKSWSWFTGWIVQPGNLAKLEHLAADLATKNWPQLVEDVAALFQGQA